jgi:glycerol-3-phosphate dehydrogenase
MVVDFRRETQIDRIASGELWDIIVIGGGATGLGIALDAASRGYRVALLEKHDFGKGTSSRSTKLIHGGIRYLQQRRFRLVHEALRERGILCRNASHLVHPLATIVPLHSQWERMYYGTGVKVYEWMSGRWSLGPSRGMSVAEATRAIPTLNGQTLVGAVRYFDGAFDDSRLLVNLMQTSIEHGAACANYAPVRELIRDGGNVCGVVAEDLETGSPLRLMARAVVNATGPFSDQIRRLDDPQTAPAIAPSQGIHLVFERQFLPGEAALIVPRTRDGRVIFAIPWHHHTIVGTTDTPVEEIPFEPRARCDEIEFLLETIAPYLSPSPEWSDIRAVFAGVRPLVRSGTSSSTSQLGRDFEVRISPSQLLSVLGGKWTTYRRMAEVAVDRTAAVAGLAEKKCRTVELAVHGSLGAASEDDFHDYGTDGPAIRELSISVPGGRETLDKRLPFVGAQVIWAARHEMARTVEDVLARRLRALFLDTEAAIAAAPQVAELLARELRRDASWQSEQLQAFQQVAEAFHPSCNR